MADAMALAGGVYGTGHGLAVKGSIGPGIDLDGQMVGSGTRRSAGATGSKRSRLGKDVDHGAAEVSGIGPTKLMTSMEQEPGPGPGRARAPYQKVRLEAPRL